MPKAPPKPCRKYGCPAMGVRDGFCEDHWRPRWQSYEPRGLRIYDKAAWKKFRKSFLRRHPVCNRCPRPAVIPHHILPIDEGGAVFDEANLEALCRDCHESHHGRKK